MFGLIGGLFVLALDVLALGLLAVGMAGFHQIRTGRTHRRFFPLGVVFSGAGIFLGALLMSPFVVLLMLGLAAWKGLPAYQTRIAR
jgi:hypothetical protein